MTQVRVLNNGITIPYVGLGTFKLRANNDADVVVNVLDTALHSGYRLIDTASCYRNEKDIGNALHLLYKNHGLTRKDLFITSKLAPKDMDYNSAVSVLQQTLTDLQCDYIDCYLIHWPGRSKLQPSDEAHRLHRKEVWSAFQDLFKRGLTRSIGVSNYTIDHLKELLQYAEIKPVLNQVEFHPHLHQRELLRFCEENDIFLQAYSSLATGQLINEPVLDKIAQSRHYSTAQVLLKWAVQQSVGVLPKSTNLAHIASNFNLSNFTLTDEEMETINALHLGKHYCWDPSTIK